MLAVDGWRIRRLDEAQQWIEPRAAFDLLLSRDQRLVTLRLQPERSVPTTLALSLAGAPAKAAAALRRAWIDA